MSAAAGDTMELRHVAEVRVSGRRIEGLAAPFDTTAQIGGFSERILPGAFATCLARNPDIRCLIDHNDEKLLGRTRSGTLRVFESRAGLAFSLDVPDTTLGRDMLTLCQRGDVNSCSFGFSVPAGGDTWSTRTTRELRCVDIHELSLLHKLPAYSGTSVSAHARQLGRHEADARLRAMVMASL